MHQNLTGMDIRQIRTLANELSNAATEINQLAHQATNDVEGVDWRGPDRDRFISGWTSTSFPDLTKTSKTLEAAASAARSYALRQEQISAR